MSPAAAPVMQSELAAIEPEVDREALRKRQNDWIKARYKEWQLAWHDIFDQDQKLDNEGEFERPDPVPDDIDHDNRLIFGLSRAERETCKRCFAMLANGEEMHRRFDEFMNSTPRVMPESEARQLVAELGRHVEAAGPDKNVDWNQITILDRHAADARETRSGYTRVESLISESPLEPASEAELAAVAAQFFLTEPLYAAAGNFYELYDWVTAVGFDPRRDKVFELAYRLWDGGWQPLVSEKGVILAYGHR